MKDAQKPDHVSLITFLINWRVTNSTGHSRAVTEIILKDGEAALLWFKEKLAS